MYKRQLQGQVGELPAALPSVLLDPAPGVHRSRLPGRQAAGGRIRDRIAHPDRLLLHPFPGHPAASRHLRAHEAAAGVDFRIGVGEARGRRNGAGRRGLGTGTVAYTHLRAHETVLDLVGRLRREKKKI